MDHDELKRVVEEVVDENTTHWVDDYLDGQESAMNYAVGQVMAKTAGRSFPARAREYLIGELEDRGLKQ